MKSLRNDLILKTLALVLVTVLLSVGTVYLTLRGAIDRVSDGVFEQYLDSVVSSLEDYLEYEYGQVTVQTGGNHAAVDRFSESTGLVATLFVREGDEFIRASTSILDDSGQRATGTSLARGEAYEALAQQGSFVGRADILDQPYVTLYRPVSGGALFVGIPAGQAGAIIAQGVGQAVRNLVIAVLLALLLAGGAVFVLGTRIATPVTVLADKIRRQGTLDFTDQNDDQRMKTYAKRKDEIGEAVRALEDMSVEIRRFVGSAQSGSEQIAGSAEELSATSEQTAATSGEVARTIDEIARAAGEQAQEIEKGTSLMNELGEIMEADARDVSELAGVCEQMKAAEKQGGEALAQLRISIEEGKALTLDTHQAVMGNVDSAEKISQSSAMIASIADQTNLLALNAAIEAARAGEHGKGFAVVAEEIRKLAEQSGRFTGEIREVIDELASRSDTAADKMKKAAGSIDKELSELNNVEERFTSISGYITTVDDTLQVFTGTSSSLLGKKEQVLDIMQNLSAIAEENAAGTQEASASVEELSASSEEIAGSTEQLTHVASNLQEQITRFRI